MANESNSGSGVVSTNQMAQYEITVGGKTVTQAEPQGLEYVNVEDHVDMAGVCELGFSLDESDIWKSVKMGSALEVKFGQDPFKVFVGTVTGLRMSFEKGRQVVSVIGMDPTVKLASSRNSRTFEGMTDSDIASKVIGDAGCTAGVVDSTSLARDWVIQRNESDLTFLRRLAARNGLLLMGTEGKVDFKKPQYGTVVEVTRDQLVSLDYTMTTRDVPSEVVARSWDYVTKEVLEATLAGGAIDLIGGGASGASKSAEMTWASQKSYVLDHWANDAGWVEDMAKSEMNRAGRQFIHGRFTVQGDGKYHAGAVFKISGVNEGYSPTVFAVGSRHRVHLKAGYVTEVMFCGNAYPE